MQFSAQPDSFAHDCSARVARGAFRGIGLLALSVAFIALSGCAAEERKAGTPSIAIVGATVIHPERDGTKASAPDSTIVISGNRIAAVGPRHAISVAAGSTIIDGRGKWVVPGLVDASVHFFRAGNLYPRPDPADFNAWMPYAKEVARNQARLPATFKVWLPRGVRAAARARGPFVHFALAGRRA